MIVWSGRHAAATVLALLLPACALAANIVIVPVDGFNNPTARSPLPRNPGDTVGEQRRNAMAYVAKLLESKIRSPVPIRVRVSFSSLDCSGNTAVLAVAGPTTSLAYTRSDRPNAKFQPGVFYPIALANALAGRDLLPPGNPSGLSADIGAKFNGHIDSANCLPGREWYYGLDGDPPGNDFNFVATAVHELIHGLGFISGVNIQTGSFTKQLPNVYDTLIRDLDRGRWPELTTEQRERSITNEHRVVFAGEATLTRGADTVCAGKTDHKIRLYAPDPVEPGSSISHLSDTIAPNDLMEPFATGDIELDDGIGLATCVLADIGWELAPGVACPDHTFDGPQDIHVTPLAIAFGTVPEGATVKRDVCIRNNGGNALTIAMITIPQSNAFSIIDNDCRNAKVLPSHTCNITIEFSPASSGQNFSASIWINSNDPDTEERNVKVSLSGRSISAEKGNGDNDGNSEGAGTNRHGGGAGCTIGGDSDHIALLLPLLLLTGLFGLGRRRLLRFKNSARQA